VRSGRYNAPSKRPGQGTMAAYQVLRANGVAPLAQDRVLAPDIERVAELIHTGKIGQAVENQLAEEKGS
jgi:histidine ammonia-lyase